jgi:hypothetical protein
VDLRTGGLGHRTCFGTGEPTTMVGLAGRQAAGLMLRCSTAKDALNGGLPSSAHVE